jgi:tRNA(adenine34) deaminase
VLAARIELIMNTQFDEKMMNAAIQEAQKAMAIGEVPVGAVIVQNGEIIATGYNRRETGKNALLHAEIEAIGKACKKLEGWRLADCELFVTLEPCPMCAGAIINARIKRVVYGTDDAKNGAVGSVANLFEMPFNHKPQVTRGVLKEQCAVLLRVFFRELRGKL